MKTGMFVISMLLAAPVMAEEAKLTFTTGMDYSSGRYGQAEKTRITYVPFTAKYETDRWILRATLPWLEIDGPGGVSADSRVIVTGQNNSGRTRQSGVGDVVVGATYSALQLNEEKLYVDVGAKVKLPTASESKGLGTGKTDYTLLTDVYKVFGKFTLIGTVGHRWLGDPSGVNLNNVWFGTLGGAFKVGERSNLGVTMDLREKTTDTSTGLREYTAFHSYKFNDTYKLQSYIVAGDTRSSVDFGAGMMLAISW